jgi:hypothetical protein
VSGQTFTPSIVGENRSWLNTSSSNNIGIHGHLDNVSTSISGISDRAHKGENITNKKKKKVSSSVLSSPRSASSKKSIQSRDRSRSVDNSSRINHTNKLGIADTYSRSSSAKNISSRNTTRIVSSKNQKVSSTNDKKSAASHTLAHSNKVRNDYGLLSSIYSAPVVQNLGRPPRPSRMKSY